MKVPDNLSKPRNILAIAIGTALFALFFYSVYSPTFGYSQLQMRTWNDCARFCTPIIAAIVFGVTLLSRLLYRWLMSRDTVAVLHYIYWQTGEYLATAAAVNLFMALYLGIPYMVLLPKVLLYTLLLLFIPYILVWLYMNNRASDRAVTLLEERVDQLQQQLADSQQQLADKEPEQGTVKFVDEKGMVKLAVPVERIIYLEAAGNYVTIVYDNSGRLVRFGLRNTLKGVADLCAENGLVRCHRSYFINLRKVKLLRRDSEGIFAELDYPDVKGIPVTKTYAADVLRLFSEK